MADPRELLKQSWDWLDSENRAEMQGLALELWRETLSASKVRQEKGMFACRKCGTENTVVMEVELPDIVTRARALEVLMNQAYGKPQESKTVTVDVGERTLEALRGLPMSELAQLAGVAWDPAVEEAEWAELPPAA